MSQYTYLFTRIAYSGKTYNSKREVEEELEQVQEGIKNAQKDIRLLAFMTEPQKWCDKNELPEYYVNNKLDDALENLDYLTVKAYKLQLLLDNWDKCHNDEGLAIECPDDIRNESYMDGDFILTTKHPTQASLLC